MTILPAPSRSSGSCSDLLDFPSAYPVIGSLAGSPVRKRVFGAYLILYEIEGADVRILAIVHGARDLDSAFN